MKLIKHILLGGLLAFTASSSLAQQVKDCKVPQFDAFAVSDFGRLTTLRQKPKYRFSDSDRIEFQVHGAFWGNYILAYHVGGGKIEQQNFNYLPSSSNPFQFPCGPSAKAGCKRVYPSKTIESKSRDDMLVLYTPCFSGASQDRDQLTRAIDPSYINAIPNCNRLHPPQYSGQEILDQMEAFSSRGCESIRSKGAPTFKKSIHIRLR